MNGQLSLDIYYLRYLDDIFYYIWTVFFTIFGYCLSIFECQLICILPRNDSLEYDVISINNATNMKIGKEIAEIMS